MTEQPRNRITVLLPPTTSKVEVWRDFPKIIKHSSALLVVVVVVDIVGRELVLIPGSLVPSVQVQYQ